MVIIQMIMNHKLILRQFFFQKWRGIYCSVLILTISNYNNLLEPIKEQEI